MKKYIIILIIVTGFCSNTFGQDTAGILKGKVTFVTSKNVYVKFDNTKNIKVGDTLQISKSNSKCLLVTNKSSKSCVTIILSGCEVKKDDDIIFKFLIKNDNIIVKTVKIDTVSTQPKEVINKNIKASKNLERINGKFSVATYSNFYDSRDTRHKVMSRFSINAEHINNSRFSVESYLNYRKESLTNTDNISPLKVYSLSLKYDVDPTLSVAFGRKINNHTSSLGAIDGLQVEKHFDKNYVGVIAGFRPDIFNYGFNSNLFQYGAYIGRITNKTNIRSQTTLGFIEQKNSGKIDRRYSYFQHSSTLYNNLNLFSSVELDLFNQINGVDMGSSRLTNFYVSARYKFNRKLNATVSFDSRKRIIYYETFQTDIERLLSDDVARQGLRFRINGKPFKYVNAGMGYSVRFQSGNQNKSENINAFVSMYKIPNFKGSLSLNYNRNLSSYLESNIVSLRHSRQIFNDKWSADFYFRFVNYNYTLSESSSNQYYFGTDLSVNIGHNLRLGLYGEYVKGSLENNYRINTKLVKRFNNKKKKK
ncbi:MAG: hypothetical protein HQ471_06795 [Flavobacteriales bacterium]|nr:hypothetical protein [Flavobacteriales bacterium]